MVTYVITPVRGLRKEDQEFKASVDYIQSRERGLGR